MRGKTIDIDSSISAGLIPLSLIRRIMDKAPFSFVLIDRGGRIKFANSHFLDLVDQDPQGIYNADAASVVSDIVPWKTREEFLLFTSRSEPWSGEVDYGKNGERCKGLVHFIPVRDDETLQEYFLLTKVDITDRVHAEQALVRSENRFRSIVQNINEYIYSVEYTAGVPGKTYHSPRCFDLTGYSPFEFDRDPNLWFSMIYPEDRVKVSEFLNNINTPFQISYIEHRINHKKLGLRWVSNSCAIHRDIHGTVLRMDGF
ncbi:MAG: PAS domain-containing protein, partial [Spirochaetota bacterium]